MTSARRALDSESTNTHISHFQFAVVIISHTAQRSAIYHSEPDEKDGRSEGGRSRTRALDLLSASKTKAQHRRASLQPTDASPGIHLLHG